MTVHHLIRVRSAPTDLRRFPQLKVQASIGLKREVGTVVANGHVGRVRTRLHHPVLLPSRAGQVRPVARGPRPHAQIHAGPHVQQFEPRFRHQALGPSGRILAFVDVHAVVRRGQDFANRMFGSAFPRDAPPVAHERPCRCRGAFEVVVPQRLVPLAGHPHGHAVRLQPRHAPAPLGAHLRRHIPLPLVGEPVEAGSLGGQGSATRQPKDHPQKGANTGHEDESTDGNTMKTLEPALRLPLRRPKRG